MTILRVGQLVEFLAESRTERVLWIDRVGGGCYMIDVADPVAAPVFRKSEEMAQLFAGGLVRETLDDPWLAPISESSLSSAHKERRDKAWTMIRLSIGFEKPAIIGVQFPATLPVAEPVVQGVHGRVPRAPRSALMADAAA
ncbi:MAG TPA: hypothetical protein VD995_27740, partial [Azospirillum sp.]|nr:hypothetical protein [Azospirillum sp.]